MLLSLIFPEVVIPVQDPIPVPTTPPPCPPRDALSEDASWVLMARGSYKPKETAHIAPVLKCSWK